MFLVVLFVFLWMVHQTLLHTTENISRGSNEEKVPICLHCRVLDSIKLSLPVTERLGTGIVKQKESKRSLSELAGEYFLCKESEVSYGKTLMIFASILIYLSFLNCD